MGCRPISATRRVADRDREELPKHELPSFSIASSLISLGVTLPIQPILILRQSLQALHPGGRIGAGRPSRQAFPGSAASSARAARLAGGLS